jgi:glyoxylase-like metal-dependent hydrolase (beta-lactamase superfamily II)
MFTELPHDCPIVPTLHLLTHTHSDHVVGLSSKSFGYTVVCSPDAKEMLLKHEVYAERSLYENGMKGEKNRTFTHLKIDPMKQLDGRISYKNSRDLLVGRKIQCTPM